MNRREFLQKQLKIIWMTSLSTSFFSCLNKKTINNLQFEIPKERRNYVQINLYGGPARWMLDNFLKPTSDDEFISNPMVGTRFINEKGHVELGLTEFGNYLIPDLWNFEFQSKRKMKSILSNAITVRGVNANTGGHPGANIKTVRPTQGLSSIHGLISDSFKTPLPSILMGSNPAVRNYSGKNKEAIFTDIELMKKKSLLEQVLSPFLVHTKRSLFQDKNQQEILLEESLKDLKEAFPQDKTFLQNLEESKKLFIENLKPFINEYDQILRKYELVAKVNSEGFSGLSSIEQFSTLDNKAFKKGAKNEDWGGHKINYDQYLRGDNIEEMFSSSHLGYIPAQFATAEFLLKKGLSNSILITTPNEMGNLLYRCQNNGNLDLKSFSQGKSIPHRSKEFSQEMDTHQTGTIMSTISQNKFYRGMMGCLDEFIEGLKKTHHHGKNSFDHTLIHLTSEFERIPKEDLSGSDHNPYSHTSTFISGAIKDFKVIGNIHIGDKEMGTIGTAGKLASMKRKLIPGDIYHSICEFMEIDNPIPRTHSLLKRKGEEVIPSITECKNIAGKSIL